MGDAHQKKGLCTIGDAACLYRNNYMPGEFDLNLAAGQEDTGGPVQSRDKRAVSKLRELNLGQLTLSVDACLTVVRC